MPLLVVFYCSRLYKLKIIKIFSPASSGVFKSQERTKALSGGFSVFPIEYKLASSKMRKLTS